MIRNRFSYTVKRFFDKTVNFTNGLMNPPVGKNLLSLQRPGLFFRIDGRKPLEMTHRGLQAPMSEQGVIALTRDHVENYQEYNTLSIGLGTCATITDLKNEFMDNNLTHVQDKHIYGMLAKASSMLEIKLDLGLDTSSRDHENEYLVFSDVPAKNVLFAVTPKEHERLFAGMAVENVLGDNKKGIPESLTLDDISSNRNVFTWLLRHDCTDMAAKVATFTLADIKNEAAIIHSIGMMGLPEQAAKTLLQGILEHINQEKEHALESVSPPTGP